MHNIILFSFPKGILFIYIYIDLYIKIKIIVCLACRLGGDGARAWPLSPDLQVFLKYIIYTSSYLCLYHPFC